MDRGEGRGWLRPQQEHVSTLCPSQLLSSRGKLRKLEYVCCSYCKEKQPSHCLKRICTYVLTILVMRHSSGKQEVKRATFLLQGFRMNSSPVVSALGPPPISPLPRSGTPLPTVHNPFPICSRPLYHALSSWLRWFWGREN